MYGSGLAFACRNIHVGIGELGRASAAEKARRGVPVGSRGVKLCMTGAYNRPDQTMCGHGLLGVGSYGVWSTKAWCKAREL